MSFQSRLSGAGSHSVDRAVLVGKKASIDLLTTIVKQTPVMDGRAKGNWNISHGSPDYSIDVHPADESQNGAASGDSTTRIVDGVNGHTTGTLYFTNNLPYIKELADGSSKQAPRGWIQASVTRFQQILKKANRELR